MARSTISRLMQRCSVTGRVKDHPRPGAQRATFASFTQSLSDGVLNSTNHYRWVVLKGPIHRQTVSPDLTVPVWPRFTPVEDSRYTVMNRETFHKKKKIAFSQSRGYRLKRKLAPVHHGIITVQHGEAPVHAGMTRYYPGWPR